MLQNQIISDFASEVDNYYITGVHKRTHKFESISHLNSTIIWLLWMCGDEMFFPDYRIQSISRPEGCDVLFSSNIRDTASENFSSIFLFPPFLESICIQEMITI